MRPLTWVRGGYGLVMACWPGQVVAVYSGRRAHTIDRAVARVLGVRQVLQAIGSAGGASRPVLLLGAEADVAHAVSMLALATCFRSRRRAGLVDALVAGSFAVATAVVAERAPMRRPAAGDGALAVLGRWRDGIAAAVAPMLLPARIMRAGNMRAGNMQAENNSGLRGM